MVQKVIVVGAGPVGLTMAAELARFGVAVRVVDKAAARTDKSKALVLWSRSLELIARMGRVDSFISAGFKAHAANIIAAGRTIGQVTFAGVASAYPYALMLPQSETERLMAAHLAAFAVQVERRVELLSFTATPEKVHVTLRHPDGREETAECAWLIGCDGAHSTVRHILGMAFEGDALPSDWVLADLHLAGVPTPPDELAMFWHADGLLALFPITPGRYRVVADVGAARGPGHRPDPTLAEIQALLDRRGPGGIVAADPLWLSAFRINERKVKDYRAGCIFLAGDAAHVHSPAGGQGMNTGIQDACNLAWKLALACRGLAAPDPLLDSYSIERSEIGRQVLANAGRLTTIAVMRGGVAQTVRNHLAALLFGFSPMRASVAETLTEINIGYPKSPLTRTGHAASGDPAAGARAPVMIAGPPVGAGDTPRFALFAPPSRRADALIARFPALLEPVTRPPFDGGGICLVRPDGYVAVSDPAGRWSDCEDILEIIQEGAAA